MLNYHHLRLFLAVAREGHLTRASEGLHLSPQTVSAQVRELEAQLGEALFDRVGRRLVLTDVGRLVQSYAEEIFGLGQEMVETVSGQRTARPTRLVIGVAEAVPKLVAYHLVEPALEVAPEVNVVCREGSPERLLADLAVHRIDVVLSDGPLPPGLSVRAFNHLLGKCGVTWMAVAGLARALRRGFPASLDAAAVLMPGDNAALRRELERWFEDLGLRPRVAGEFDDSALLKVFGRAGAGVFPVPSVIEGEVARQYGVEVVGRTPEVVERFYALSAERRIRHPGVAAICDAARSELFAGAP